MSRLLVSFLIRPTIKQHTSSRSRAWLQLMFVRIDLYQSISNLSVASKLLERLVTLVARQVIVYLQSNNLLGYLINSLLIDQVFLPIPQPCGCCLTFCRPSMNEMSWASWHYSICRPQHITETSTVVICMFDGLALQWFRSYLTGRTQAVCRGSQQSARHLSLVALHKGQFLGQSCLLSLCIHS